MKHHSPQRIPPRSTARETTKPTPALSLARAHWLRLDDLSRRGESTEVTARYARPLSEGLGTELHARCPGEMSPAGHPPENACRPQVCCPIRRSTESRRPGPGARGSVTRSAPPGSGGIPPDRPPRTSQPLPQSPNPVDAASRPGLCEGRRPGRARRRPFGHGRSSPAPDLGVMLTSVSQGGRPKLVRRVSGCPPSMNPPTALRGAEKSGMAPPPQPAIRAAIRLCSAR